jgi:putative transposase
VVEMAVALKRENPERTGAQVRRILAAQMGWAPGERTLQRWFTDDPTITDLMSAGATGPVFGRFEALRPNELWTGDALHGPTVGGRKTYLFAFLDDHSRAIMGHRFGFAEDTVRLAAALRPALGSRGVPDGIYVDNGSAFVDAWLLRACAKLGIRLIHSTPGRPQGRGKIERYFRTVREQFLVEITGDPTDPSRHPVADLGELNRLFTAWVETVYHRQIHSETGAAPLARWQAGGPFGLPTPDALAEAFLWEEHRTVTKTALVSLQGNTYQVDPALVGRRVELVFDPFDLTTIAVRLRGVPAGTAIPHRIGRHAHLKARPETPPELPAPTGIDYARLIDRTHQAQLGDPVNGVNYAALAGSAPTGSNDPTSSNDQLPGQLDLLTDGPTTDGEVVS